MSTPARAFAYAAHIGQQYGSGHYITHLDNLLGWKEKP